MVQKVLTLTAWVFIAFLAYSSLTDVEFVDSIYYKLSPFLMRPSIWAYPHFEHLLVFMAFGVLLSSAYPGRIFFVCCVVFSSALVLGYLQTLTPDRHGTSIDAIEKVFGESSESRLLRSDILFVNDGRTTAAGLSWWRSMTSQANVSHWRLTHRRAISGAQAH
jgi:hypothetical protein